MTRIKKRRSGKKRVSDRKKASAGRRGARATAVKEQSGKQAGERTNEEPANQKKIVATKQTGKARSAGSRRIAAAKSVVFTAGSAIPKKSVTSDKETAEKKPVKGFAPWNKNKFKKKSTAAKTVTIQSKKPSARKKK